jgi:hypothetical protein
MDTCAPNDAFMRSLAEEIAFGRCASIWARSREVPAETALEWIELPQFREFVEKCRVNHAERMVGKIAGCVERAIDRLVELSEYALKPSIALAATKAIIENWLNLSIHFVQERTYQKLVAQVKVLKDAKKEADKRARRGGLW